MWLCKLSVWGMVWCRGWAFQFAMPRVPPGYGPGAATFFGGPGPGYWNAPGPGSATSAPSSSVRSLAEMSTADTGQDDRDDSSPFGYTSATTHQVLRGLVGGAIAVFMVVWANAQVMMQTIQIHSNLAIIRLIGGWLLCVCVPLGTQDIITFIWG